MPDEPVVDKQTENDQEPTPAEGEKATEAKPTQAPQEQPVEHPEFQKRINGLVGQINHLKTQLDKQNLIRGADQETFKVLAKQNKDLAELLEKVEDQVSSSTGPNFDDDPQGYIDGRFNRILGKLEKIAKPANETPEPQAQPGVPNFDSTITAQREVQAALHDDYYELLKDTEADMRVDPAVANTIMGSPNPPKAAYEYGVRKKKLAEQARQETLRQGYVEGGAPAPSKQDINSLTAEEKSLAGNLGISEAKYLVRKQLIAKRGG